MQTNVVQFNMIFPVVKISSSNLCYFYMGIILISYPAELKPCGIQLPNGLIIV